jgi:hypothetical protein
MAEEHLAIANGSFENAGLDKIRPLEAWRLFVTHE